MNATKRGTAPLTTVRGQSRHTSTATRGELFAHVVSRLSVARRAPSPPDRGCTDPPALQRKYASYTAVNDVVPTRCSRRLQSAGRPSPTSTIKYSYCRPRVPSLSARVSRLSGFCRIPTATIPSWQMDFPTEAAKKTKTQ